MKKLLAAFTALVIAFVLSTASVQANEGSLNLSNSEISCEGVSLWKESTYRVMGRCAGLVYPYETQYEHYVVWAKTVARGEFSRIGEVDRGYFDGNVSEAFSSIYISAETTGLPRRPSDKTVISGNVIPFDFDTTVDTTVEETTPAEDVAGSSDTMTVQSGSNVTSASSSTIGKVVGKILTSLLVIVGVVILLVIVTSLIFRRRGSVNA